MPIIKPIRDLRDTSEISSLAHESKQPIFITKNGYSDLVVMSSEVFDKYQKRIQTLKEDLAIMKSEKEFAEKGVSFSLEEVKKKLDSKFYEDL